MIIRPMIYTFGRIFFPRLIHEEKKLRARLRALAIGGAILLVVGVGVVAYCLNSGKLAADGYSKDSGHNLGKVR